MARLLPAVQHHSLGVPGSLRPPPCPATTVGAAAELCCCTCLWGPHLVRVWPGLFLLCLRLQPCLAAVVHVWGSKDGVCQLVG